MIEQEDVPDRHAYDAQHLPRFIEYPYPLREHFTVRLLLPRDLSTAEVRRLSEFLTTLAVDYKSEEDGDE